MGRVAVWLSAAFWLLMMGLLFKVEILPEYAAVETAGYQSMVRDIDVPVVREMAVMKDGERVGTSTTVITPEPDGTFRISNSSEVDVQMGVVAARANASFNLTLDEEKHLRELFLRVDIAGQRAGVSGRPADGRLELRISIGGETFTHTVPYDDSMFSSYFNPFATAGRLSVGQEWRTRFLDPLRQKVTTARVRVVGRERISLQIREGAPPVTFDAYKLVMSWGAIELNAWATRDGLVLKEETPWGYTLVYREPEEEEENDRADAGEQGLRPEAGRK